MHQKVTEWMTGDAEPGFHRHSAGSAVPGAREVGARSGHHLRHTHCICDTPAAPRSPGGSAAPRFHTGRAFEFEYGGSSKSSAMEARFPGVPDWPARLRRAGISRIPEIPRWPKYRRFRQVLRKSPRPPAGSGRAGTVRAAGAEPADSGARRISGPPAHATQYHAIRAAFHLAAGGRGTALSEASCLTATHMHVFAGIRPGHAPSGTCGDLTAGNTVAITV